MTVVRIVTRIAASPEACFDLARDVDVHAESLAHTGERVTEKPEGRSHLEMGDTVTFEGDHLGLRIRHRARITAYDRPQHFRDEMVEGLFRVFVHHHTFVPAQPREDRPTPEASGDTLMRDTVRFALPLRWGGWIAERVVATPYLRRVLRQRADALRAAAEAHEASGARGPETQG